MSANEVERALLEAARLEPEEDVLVLGGGALALGAHERIGDGWVYVVRSQVDELEELLGRGACRGGERRCVPGRVLRRCCRFPDGAVACCARANRDGGRGARRGGGGARARAVAPAGASRSPSPGRRRGEELARSLGAAGFEEVEVAEAGGEAVVSRPARAEDAGAGRRTRIASARKPHSAVTVRRVR